MKRLKLGVVGLGRAFALTVPTLARDNRVQIVAATDPRPEARAKAEKDFGANPAGSMEELLKADIDAVYIASPHQFHAAQACAAAAAGKHVLVEKPMALSLDECRAMADAARKHRVQIVVGPSHSFDGPIRKARQLMASGRYGRVRMITALNFTDFLYRPRRPEELATAVMNQAAHHVDIVRVLAPSPLQSVRAQTGSFDPARPADGAYSALLGFEGGFATVVYSGYAHFDSDDWMGGIGELGQQKDPSQYGAARKALAGRDELAYKDARNYGGAEFRPGSPQHHEHFGPLIVSCEKADLRPLPNGVMIHGDGEQRLEALSPTDAPRSGVIDELYDAVVNARPPLHDAMWGLATTEACLAILESARSGREIPLKHQTNASRT